MEEIILQNDLNKACRLCLTNKFLLFEITEVKRNMFKDLTQEELPITDELPSLMCDHCSDQLENFHFYKCQLKLKQEQLQTMILNQFHNSSEFDDLLQFEEDEKVVEEYLDEDLIIEETIILPSIKLIQDKSNNKAIINLIDELEKKNQMIFELSKPQPKTKKQKTANQLNKPNIRNEALIYQNVTPKLIIKPAIVDDGSPQDKAGGIVLFSRDNNKCNICDRKFNSDLQLKRHQLSAHPLPEPIKCCDGVFNFMKDFNKHQTSAHSNSIVCPHCGKLLKSRKTFQVHKRCHQSISERKFKCSYSNCTKAFNFKLHLENHERTHSGEKPFKCNKCPAKFKQSYQLTMHKRKHETINEKKGHNKIKFKENDFSET